MYFQKVMMVLMISLFMLTVVIPQSIAKEPITQSMTVVVGSSCTCGNHYGGCEAMHNGRKISMDFEYNVNAANPISHPLNVFEGKKKVKDWEELLCPPGLEPAKVSLSGKQVVVEGRFINKNTFMAHKIQIMP